MQVAHNQRGRNASQANMGGTGIGSFNDRFRDAALGGSPFATPRHQGWVTGLYTQPSAFSQVCSRQKLDRNRAERKMSADLDGGWDAWKPRLFGLAFPAVALFW